MCGNSKFPTPTREVFLEKEEGLPASNTYICTSVLVLLKTPTFITVVLVNNNTLFIINRCNFFMMRRILVIEKESTKIL